ncbi:putative tubulin polyglutamylase ttll-15 isoform X4 [Oratosquilla oratoria]|uniref:putative tubulin polyglutamylase ttll-15 isoform X4 n=1 Tax=Oratosquilla oratoria TaxID=337810 RepID=UPI003F759A46
MLIHSDGCMIGTMMGSSSNTVTGGVVMSKRQIRFVMVAGMALLFGLVLTALNVYELHRLTKEHWSKAHIGRRSAVVEGQDQYFGHPIAWVRGNHLETGYLSHVTNVLTRIGYELGDEKDSWDILWSHNYPFKELKSIMKQLKPHQRVNHFPGSGYISNKLNLATSGLDNIPRAYRMPDEKDKLLEYAKQHPDIMYVQKSNNHRGIKIEKLDNLNLKADGSFIQEFIHTPLLIDGHKFDIGVYTIVTSIKPLRVYIYEGDVLFRFCPEKYHPFDPEIRDKYVVGDDYLPTWKVPSLQKYYVDLGLGMKNSFDAWLRAKDKDPEVVWDAVRDAIRTIFYNKEPSLIQASSHYRSTSNFFEMMRFDFIIDDKFKVHLMEANMSPNLSSAHFKENRLLYEQVIYNLFSLVGVARHVHSRTLSPVTKEEAEMQLAVKDVMVFPDHCAVNCQEKDNCKNHDECQLCNHCLSVDQIQALKAAYHEHNSRGMCRRVVPAPIRLEDAHEATDMSGLTHENTWMTEWFRGKCLLDSTFCK